MGERIVADVKACHSCTVGSCCYEGTELTAQEVRRILTFKPKIAKPWFRHVEKHEEPSKTHPFSTIVRNGSCVFHDKNNRCMIYSVRPKFCKEFPLENGKTATFYARLCVLFKDKWHPRSNVRKVYFEREKR